MPRRGATSTKWREWCATRSLRVRIWPRIVRDGSATVALNPDCESTHTLRDQKLIELGRLQARIENQSSGDWPQGLIVQYASLNADLNRLRERWIQLGCASQL